MFSKSAFHTFLFTVFVAAACCVSADSQTKKKNPKRPATPPAAVAVKAEVPNTDPPQPEPGVKRNARPVEEPQRQIVVPQTISGPLYGYEFTQPDFINSRIVIEHDDGGKGTIKFQRRGHPELFSEPLAVSETALAKLRAAFADLKFLDSTENYQHEKDFSNMGNSRITLANGEKSRSVTINYTVNKNAKVLLDEYRKISNQALWIFDVTIARENQPLDGPSQMAALEGLLKRNEISDPLQLLPFLRELADDERLPLIARNHATRIIQQIEKAKK